MAHKKKENREHKRKQPIPPVSAHPTKKQKQAKEKTKKNWLKEIRHD